MYNIGVGIMEYDSRKNKLSYRFIKKKNIGVIKFLSKVYKLAQTSITVIAILVLEIISTTLASRSSRIITICKMKIYPIAHFLTCQRHTATTISKPLWVALVFK